MRVNPAMQAFLSHSQGIRSTDLESKTNFSELLQNELHRINDLQIKGDEANQQLISGESEDIHSVLLATEEARLSMELAIQVRNKIIESYQEISRMQL